MAGMIPGGANPVYAALYQFVIMALISAAGGLTSLLTSLLMGRRAVTEAEQLRHIDAEGSGQGAVCPASCFDNPP